MRTNGESKPKRLHDARKFSLSNLKGQQWATGKTEEDALEKVEEGLGREWFALTAFPLFAGTFGPIASALNICALVQPWRSIVPPGATQDQGIDIDDPSWLLGLNSLSLVFGVAANIAILLVVSFPGYARWLILTTVIGGYSATAVLVACVLGCAYGLPSQATGDYTGAFYYAILAAVVYFISSSFVIYSAHMLREQIGNYNDSSKLEFAKGHRGLMVLTITLMGYILIWAEIFAKIEGWHYLDAVYWADVTLLTVGFGDFTPETHLGRSLLIPFAAFGILLLGSVIYRITRVVFGRGRSMWELRLRDEERRKRVRKRERQRTRSKNITNEEKLKAVLQNGNGNHVQRLSKSEAIAAKKEEAREARRQDFELMREVLQRTSKKRLRYSVLIWASLTMILWIAGAAVFYGIGKGEGWTYFKAVYFTWISILAIGYGDNTLNTNFGKAFFVLWSLIVVPTLTMLISASVQAFGEPSQRGAHIKKWFQKFILGRKPPKLEHATSLKPDDMPDVRNLHHNTHDRNHLLIQAVKKVAADHIKSEQKGERPDYSFEDWEYIFYLMGVLEPDPAFQSELKRSDNSAEHLNRAKSSGSMLRIRTRSSTLGGWTDGNGALDWLHGQNPLNVTDTLTEWMLLTLVEKLELELLDMRKKMGNTHVEETPNEIAAEDTLVEESTGVADPSV